jgi:glutaconate CoA-transferase, subunit A
MAETVPLAVAVASLVARSGRIALKGRVHLIPYAAGREVIRQTKLNPTLIPVSLDQICDAPIGLGRTRDLEFSRAGGPGIASPHRTGDAIEAHWPRKLEIKERSLRTCGGARPKARAA